MKILITVLKGRSRFADEQRGRTEQSVFSSCSLVQPTSALHSSRVEATQQRMPAHNSAARSIALLEHSAVFEAGHAAKDD